MERYCGLCKAVIALDPNKLVSVLLGHYVFRKLLVEECLKLVWVAYRLPTERASNVMFDIAVVARTMQ